MNRFLAAALFFVLTVGLAVFLWQKQIQSYEFSLDEEKQAIGGLKEVAKDFSRNLPSFEIPDEVLKELEQYRLEAASSTTPGSATSTETEKEHNEAELKDFNAFFEGLESNEYR